MSPATNVLVVDDDPVSRRLVQAALSDDVFNVEEQIDGEGAWSILQESPPDLMILDIELPGMSGFELLARLGGRAPFPVLVVSGKRSESDRVLGFDLGAADYVVKPFFPRELEARARRLIDGPVSRGSRVAICHPPLRLVPAERRAWLDDEELDLTPREYDLLVHFAGRPHIVVGRSELLEDVWRSRDDWQDPATVTEHVRRLRSKLGPCGSWIETVRGVGYRFAPAVERPVTTPAQHSV